MSAANRARRLVASQGALIAAVLALVAIYTVGFSALGGWLGNYIRTDTDLGN
jgi:hypothetical protein